MIDRFVILLAQGSTGTGSTGSSGGAVPTSPVIVAPSTVGTTPAAVDRTLTVLPGNGSLVDKIKSGDIHLSDVPAFISSFIQVAIMFAGIVAFIMVLVGGYQYIIGGIYSDMREQGKNTLMYAITGLVLSLLAYGIVNLIQLFATGL